MASLIPSIRFQAFDSAGAPLSGGLLYAYQAGTSTPLDTYTSAAGDTANDHPVTLNPNGEAAVFIEDAAYKFVLTNAAGTELWTQDNVQSDAGLVKADLASVASVSKGASLIGYKHGGSTGAFSTGASARSLDAKLDDFGVWVTDFGADPANTGAQNIAAFQAAAAAAVALKSSYQFDSQYYTGVPVVRIPAGTFDLDVSTDNVFDTAAFGMGANNFAGVHLKGDGMFSTTLKLTGANYLMYNDNDWEASEISDLAVIGVNGTEGFYYLTSAGVAKHPRISNVWTQNVLNNVILEGGNPGGNADHLRMFNVVLDEIPATGFGIRINNSQSIAHVCMGCKIRLCKGTGIKLEDGAPLEWFGGSFTVGDGGRGVHVEGSNLGSGNSMVNFYGIKPELYPQGGTDPDFLYMAASATVTFTNSVITQDGRATKTTPVVTITRGNLVVRGCRWVKTWIVDVTPDNAAATSNFPPEVVFDGCQFNGQLQEFVTLNNPAGGDSNYTSRAKARAVNCSSYSAFDTSGGRTVHVPVDVDLNWDSGDSGLAPTVKRAIYRRAAAKTGGLPDTTPFAFDVPLGATVVAVGVHHKVSASAFRANYTIADGDTNTLLTTSGPTTGEIDETDDYIERLELSTPVYCDDDTTRAFTCVAAGTTATVTQDGYVFVDYI